MAERKRPRIPVPARVERALDTALDHALNIERPMVLAYLDRARRKYPWMTPAQLVTRLERQYLTGVAGIGGAAGATAALPGVGMPAAIAAGGAEITAFVSASALYVLALAEIHGVPLHDPAVRRALVLSVLVGDASEVAIEGIRRGESRWAYVISRPVGADRDAITVLNTQLVKLLIRRTGTRQTALLLGRAVPLGIGAVIGAGGNLTLARGAITAARRAFGPAPATFPPRVVDVDVPEVDDAG
ncbi:MAG TPA: hypothetical protein VFU35_13610 [Jatrophihabitans sp.]|nr:hypothetical protein [Jatrophihabitans sp.]